MQGHSRPFEVNWGHSRSLRPFEAIILKSQFLKSKKKFLDKNSCFETVCNDSDLAGIKAIGLLLWHDAIRDKLLSACHNNATTHSSVSDSSLEISPEDFYVSFISREMCALPYPLAFKESPTLQMAKK